VFHRLSQKTRFSLILSTEYHETHGKSIIEPITPDHGRIKMKLEGKTFKMNVVLQMHVVDHVNEKASFVKELDEALVLLCREMNVPFPLWLSKNTREFAQFHQTTFFEDQFSDNKVPFDRFMIRLIG